MNYFILSLAFLFSPGIVAGGSSLEIKCLMMFNPGFSRERIQNFLSEDVNIRSCWELLSKKGLLEDKEKIKEALPNILNEEQVEILMTDLKIAAAVYKLLPTSIPEEWKPTCDHLTVIDAFLEPRETMEFLEATKEPGNGLFLKPSACNINGVLNYIMHEEFLKGTFWYLVGSPLIGFKGIEKQDINKFLEYFEKVGNHITNLIDLKLWILRMHTVFNNVCSPKCSSKQALITLFKTWNSIRARIVEKFFPDGCDAQSDPILCKVFLSSKSFSGNKAILGLLSADVSCWFEFFKDLPLDSKLVAFWVVELASTIGDQFNGLNGIRDREGVYSWLFRRGLSDFAGIYLKAPPFFEKYLKLFATDEDDLIEQAICGIAYYANKEPYNGLFHYLLSRDDFKSIGKTVFHRATLNSTTAIATKFSDHITGARSKTGVLNLVPTVSQLKSGVAPEDVFLFRSWYFIVSGLKNKDHFKELQGRLPNFLAPGIRKPTSSYGYYWVNQLFKLAIERRLFVQLKNGLWALDYNLSPEAAFFCGYLLNRMYSLSIANPPGWDIQFDGAFFKMVFSGTPQDYFDATYSPKEANGKISGYKTKFGFKGRDLFFGADFFAANERVIPSTVDLSVRYKDVPLYLIWKDSTFEEMQSNNDEYKFDVSSATEFKVKKTLNPEEMLMILKENYLDVVNAFKKGFYLGTAFIQSGWGTGNVGWINKFLEPEVDHRAIYGSFSPLPRMIITSLDGQTQIDDQKQPLFSAVFFKFINALYPRERKLFTEVFFGARINIFKDKRTILLSNDLENLHSLPNPFLQDPPDDLEKLDGELHRHLLRNLVDDVMRSLNLPEINIEDYLTSFEVIPSIKTLYTQDKVEIPVVSLVQLILSLAAPLTRGGFNAHFTLNSKVASIDSEEEKSLVSKDLQEWLDNQISRDDLNYKSFRKLKRNLNRQARHRNKAQDQPTKDNLNFDGAALDKLTEEFGHLRVEDGQNKVIDHVAHEDKLAKLSELPHVDHRQTHKLRNMPFEELGLPNAWKKMNFDQDNRIDKDKLVVAWYNAFWLFEDPINVHGFTRDKPEQIAQHIQHTANVLNRTEADVIVLSEVQNVHVLEEVIRAMGKEGIYYPICAETGDTLYGMHVCLISKTHPIRLPYSFEDLKIKYEFNNVLLQATVAKNIVAEFEFRTSANETRKVVIIGVHLRSGEEDIAIAYREAQATIILNQVNLLREEGYSVIVAGDLNDHDHDPAYRGHRDHSTSSTTLSKIKHGGRLLQANRKLAPWLKYTHASGATIDHILYSGDLKLDHFRTYNPPNLQKFRRTYTPGQDPDHFAIAATYTLVNLAQHIDQ